MDEVCFDFVGYGASSGKAPDHAGSGLCSPFLVAVVLGMCVSKTFQKSCRKRCSHCIHNDCPRNSLI